MVRKSSFLILSLFLLCCCSLVHKRFPSSDKDNVFDRLNEDELKAYDLSNRDEITVLAFGDAGTAEYDQFILGEMMYKICKTHQCDFALVLGDNFYDEEYFYEENDLRINSLTRSNKRRCLKESQTLGEVADRDEKFSEDGVLCPEDPKFRYMFELPYRSLNEKIDNFMFWPVLGNHDYDDDVKSNVNAQINYTKISNTWKMPARYYQIPKLPSWLKMFAFDTEMITGEDEAHDLKQLQFAKKSLCANDSSAWKITFGHHPLLSYSLRGSYKGLYQNHNKDDMDIMADHIYPILDKCRVDMYLSGHDHIQQHVVINDKIHHIVQGAGSSANPLLSEFKEASDNPWKDAETYIHKSYTKVDKLHAKGRTLGFSIIKFTKKKADITFYDLINERTTNGYSFRVEKSYERTVLKK